MFYLFGKNEDLYCKEHSYQKYLFEEWRNGSRVKKFKSESEALELKKQMKEDASLLLMGHRADKVDSFQVKTITVNAL